MELGYMLDGNVKSGYTEIATGFMPNNKTNPFYVEKPTYNDKVLILIFYICVYDLLTDSCRNCHCFCYNCWIYCRNAETKRILQEPYRQRYCLILFSLAYILSYFNLLIQFQVTSPSLS
jgi:hypothetical protein